MLLLQLNFSLFYGKLLGVLSALWNGEGVFSTWTAFCQGEQTYSQTGISTGFHFLSEDTPCGAEAVGTRACTAGMNLSWFFHGCSCFFISWQNPGGFGEFEWRPVFHIQLVNHHCFWVCKWMTSVTPCKIPIPYFSLDFAIARPQSTEPLLPLCCAKLCLSKYWEAFLPSETCPEGQAWQWAGSHSGMALPSVGLEGAEGHKFGPWACVWREVTACSGANAL